MARCDCCGNVAEFVFKSEEEEENSCGVMEPKVLLLACRRCAEAQPQINWRKRGW